MYGSIPFLRPESLDEAIARLRHEPGRWTPIAGGTDLMVRMRDGHVRPAGLLDLTGVSELAGIRVADGFVVIGALATHAAIEASEAVRRYGPALASAAAVVGSCAIRNRGTIGGNLANASPAADTVPPLVALGAEVGIAGHSGVQWIPVEAFATAPGRNVLKEGELVASVRFPAREGAVSAFERLGTRRALAIAKVSVAVAGVRTADGTLSDVRVALGSVAPTVVRAPSAEAAIDGRVPDPDVVAAAAEGARVDARPISDIRSDAEYRREMCAVLLRRAVAAL